MAGALGAGPAQSQNRPPAPAVAVPAAVSPRAAIWAATAAYVYEDDRDLDKIRPALLKTISSSSVDAFNRSVDEAVKLEKRSDGPNHLLKFQELVKTIQAQPLDPNDPAALVKAIVGKLDDNRERMTDPARAKQLAALEQQLNRLAAGTASAPAATAAVPPPAADNPMNQVAALPADAPAVPEREVAVSVPPVAAPVALAGAGVGAPAWVSWLALGLSGLSFLGMMLLFRKQDRPAAIVATMVPPAEPERSGRQDSRQDSRKEPAVNWKKMQEYVKQQIDERLNANGTGAPLVPAAAPVAVATFATPVAPLAALPDELEAALTPLPVAPAGPRLRTQYVNEAPFNNAFRAQGLSDQPGAYSTFAVTSSEQQPDQGTFAVTGNMVSHISDHRNVLEPVCDYVNGFPAGSEARVITVEPGQVRRRGNDWEVAQPAKVRFE